MKKPLFCWRFLAFLLFLSILLGILFGVTVTTRKKSDLDVVNKNNLGITKTIVLDAGHGGEDGGASSADGLLEKRYVTTGKSLWGNYTEILEGLSPEDFLAFPYGKHLQEGAPAVESDISTLYQ